MILVNVLNEISEIIDLYRLPAKFFFKVKEAFYLECEKNYELESLNEEMKLYWDENINYIHQDDSFFHYTKLIFWFGDFVFLRTLNKEHSLWLVDNYRIDKQFCCIKNIFKVPKNIILVYSDLFLINVNSINNEKEEELFILFKDKRTAYKCLFKNNKENEFKNYLNFWS